MTSIVVEAGTTTVEATNGVGIGATATVAPGTGCTTVIIGGGGGNGGPGTGCLFMMGKGMVSRAPLI
jgi:hypothetical protein